MPPPPRVQIGLKTQVKELKYEFLLFSSFSQVSNKNTRIDVSEYMNLKKESDANFSRSNNLAKRDALKVGKSDYKDHIMFMAGNKLLKDKIYSFTQRSVTKCIINSQAKNSLTLDIRK